MRQSPKGRGAALLALALLGCSATDDNRPVEWSLPDDAFWPDLRDYPGVGEGRIIATNNLDDTLSILDLAQVGTDDLAEIARVPVGLIAVEREGPHHLAEDRSGEFYYVGISNFVPLSGSGPHGVHGAGSADGHVLKLRSSDNIQVGAVRVDRNPGDVRLVPDGSKLLVSHFDLLRISEVIEDEGELEEMSSTLAIVDPETMTREALVDLCPATHGIAVAPDGRTAYVSCLDDSMVVVDLVSEEHPVRKLPVIDEPGPVSLPFCYPYAMTISPDGESVWVSCFTSGDVLRYDVAAEAMDPAGRVTLPGPAVFGAFSPDGTSLVVPFQQSAGVGFIDPADGALQIVDLTPEDCQNAHAVRFTHDGAFILLVCEGDHLAPGTLVVIDPVTRTVQHSTPLGILPDDIAIVGGPQ